MHERNANDLKSGIKKHTLFLFILAVLVFAAYFNSLNNAFVSDDLVSFPRNADIDKVKSFWNPPFFYPRTFLIFIIYKLFGLNPLFYRLLNILLHLGSVWVVYFLLNLTFRPPLPLYAAGIFAVHPILCESITWISGGPYAQYSFFLLVCLFLYIRSENNLKIYIWSVFFFLLSLLSSEKAMVLPLILISWEISLKKLLYHWRKLVPFFLLGGLWILMYVGKIGQQADILQAQYYQEKGVNNPFLQIPIAVTSYLELIFWPDKLTLYHSEMSFTWTEYLIRLAVFILFLGAIAYSYKRKPAIFFWSSFFIISLLPTLTPFRISWIVAERYVYLGALGIIVVSAMALERLWERENLKPLAYILFCLIIISLSIRTIIRNIDWKNEDNLWFSSARTSPSSHNNHNNLGDVYVRRGDWDAALGEFKIAIRIKPNYADAYHNLATTYLNLGKVNEAIENYRQAVYFNPGLWQSYQNLAAIYFQLEEYGLAQECLLQALKLNPANAVLHANLGVVYLKQGQILKAKDEVRKACELNPGDLKMKELMATILKKSG